MSKELVGKNGKQVGTQGYLDAINKSTGLDIWMHSGDTYADAMKTLCEREKRGGSVQQGVYRLHRKTGI